MVSLGTASVVDASAINTVDIAELSSTLSIVAYAETTDVKARTVTIADPPTVNAEATVENSTLQNNVFDEIVLVPMTSTSAMILYKNGLSGTMKARVLTVSGTTITANSPITLSDTLGTSPTSVSGCKVTSTNILVCYNTNISAGTAVILSISGTTITENTTEPFETLPFGAGAGGTKCIAYSTTKAIVTFISTFSVVTYGNIIDISGTTLTANSEKSIGISGSNDENISSSLARMSSTKAVLAINSSGNTTSNVVLTLNGATFDIGTQKDIAGRTTTGTNAITPLSETSLLVSVANSSSDMLVTQLDISGVGDDELTQIGSDTLVLSTISYIKSTPVDSSSVIIHYIGASSSVILATVAATLGLASMTKPADVDAAGQYIYLALLSDGTPILTKIATDLLSDGSTVFDPGAGDNIGVQCGKFNSDVVWVAGNFDGTNVIEKSENAGSSFVVKDPATFDPVTSFVVGPDSDDRVLVFADAGGSVASSNIQETIDSGASWDQKDSGLGFISKAVERLDINVEEIVTGNEAGASDNIHYSPNTGQDLEDYSTGFPTQDVTKLIVG